MKHIILTLTLVFGALMSCHDTINMSVETGVSWQLAQDRKENISNLEYDLYFEIPDSISDRVEGAVEIKFDLPSKQTIVIDYLNDRESIHSVEINGHKADYIYEKEHIIISSKQSQKGSNRIKINFTASDQSLNRRSEFLYTLLVPDRARTLFPCFDQPNLKARFTAQVEIPAQWSAVSNGKIADQQQIGSRKVIKFTQTEPLSTYLFSVVAGKLEAITQSQGERSITLYHREIDPAKIAQTDEIFRQVFASLDFMETYTGIDYPFAKYDLVILPGFQYGGMEHTGATIYSDRVMFLDPNPTINEKLSRTSLIAHETAHMWFGDYVTMNWFNDVWTKEVFANYFASQIVAPQFPEVDHDLNFMLSYSPSAYAEDRTAGSNPIQQELDNLQDAGLVYGNIIYKKSPVVMNMLVEMVGKDKFQQGIRSYLTKYGYSNATWDDLIAILDELTTSDLQYWSDVWIKQCSMPTIDIKDHTIRQNDPLGRGLIWGQPLELLAIRSGKTKKINVLLEDENQILDSDAQYYIANSNGRGYGYFKMDSLSSAYIMGNLAYFEDDIVRGSAMINLYENLLNDNIRPSDFISAMVAYLPSESNALLFNQALSYTRSCNQLYKLQNPDFEAMLWSIYLSKSPHSLTAFRTLISVAYQPQSLDKLYELWDSNNQLSESDAIRLSYQLAVHKPDKAQEILQTQLCRIKNKDRISEYQFVSKAVSPDQAVRDSVFASLLLDKNRTIEPWASQSLGLLNHPLRQRESLGYIRPGLDVVAQIQRTGDIFFPAAWSGALLGGHNSREAYEIVRQFFDDNQDYPDKLANKIKQRADHLFRLHAK